MNDNDYNKIKYTGNNKDEVIAFIKDNYFIVNNDEKDLNIISFFDDDGILMKLEINNSLVINKVDNREYYII